MKILEINSVCGIRSTGRIVTDLAEKFIREGNECKIAYGRGTVPDKYFNLSYRIGNSQSVKINALKARLFDNEGFNARKNTKRFIEWANNYDPDVLWLHNLHGYYINIDILFHWVKSRPQMKVIWTLHDCWAFTGHCAHFSYIHCHQWKDGCICCKQSNEYPKSLFFDNCKKNYIEKKELFTGIPNMTIITPSYWLADLVKDSFLREYAVKVVHNTIDQDAFRPTKSSFRQKYSIGDRFIILGVASSWSDRKGLNDFIKLSKRISSSFVIVLVGLTKKQIRKIPDNIVCIERTNTKKELAEIYTSADVFLNLTYEDTYPTVNLEAQACGTRCITYRTGGSVESVSPENIVEQGDLDAIMTILDKMKENSND